MNDTFFAIKNINTGELLSYDKAQTRAKFSNIKPPKLYQTKGAATNSMNCWILGEWHNQVNFEGDHEGILPPDKQPEDRKEIAQYLRVVELQIKINGE